MYDRLSARMGYTDSGDTSHPVAMLFLLKKKKIVVVVVGSLMMNEKKTSNINMLNSELVVNSSFIYSHQLI